MLCKSSTDWMTMRSCRIALVGVPAEVGAKQIAKLDPGVTMAVAGAVYFHGCGISPRRNLEACSRK